MRYSRVVNSDTPYFTSTAVLLSELTKLVVCLVIAGQDSIKQNRGVLSYTRMWEEILGNDSWKMLIPAGLYTLQNNLQYVSVSLLDAATFQVTYQLKILTTALCSVILLGTILGRMKWISLVLLTAGVALVQFPSGDDTKKKGGVSAAGQLMGLVSVLVGCVLSGLAGVYFEKVLKGSNTSLWVRNVQLSLFSTAPALFGVMVVDGRGVREHGFFYGYTKWTVFAILLQAFGGLIVAVVVKYADNILKGFATSISIILSCLVSVWAFDFHISITFVLGTTLVIYSTYMYGKYSMLTPKQPPSTLPTTEREAQDDDQTVNVPMEKITTKNTAQMR